MTFKKPSCIYVVLLVVTIIVFVGSLFAQGLVMTDSLEDLSNDVRPTKIYNDPDDYEDTQFGPASWAFSIWFVIFSWQAVFLIYCVLSCFERFDLHRVPIACLPFYNLANLGGVGWTVLSEKFEWHWPDLGCIAVMPISLYICFIISIRSLNRRNCKYFLYTYCVHNAWGIFAGWTSVAVLLWLSNCLIYATTGPSMTQKATATIMFGILMGELVVFCSLELTVWDKFLRHVWTHYIALATAITGSIIRNWDPENRNTIMAVAIAGFVTCAFLVKLMKLMYCERPDTPKNEHKYLEGKDNNGLEKENGIPEILVTPNTPGEQQKAAL